MFRKLLLAFSLVLYLQQLHATHIVGGEMTYRCLGNDDYEITLQVFRDCYNGIPWFDSIAWVAIYSNSWNDIQVLKMRYDGSNDTLPIVLSNPCLVAPPDVCVNTATYRDTVNLPFVAGGYSIVYQRCCRNQSILNIVDPLETGASFMAHISEEALTGCNSSAVFKTWPPVAICINYPIDFDHGAIDSDGDQLVYKLCTPLTGGTFQAPIPMPPPPGPYTPVTWINPYSMDDMLGGQPMQIDPQTGFITGIPNLLGQFVVGICVEEYRDGVLISTTRRDFQYNVSDCGSPVAAFFGPKTLCDTKTIQFENQSDRANDYKWFFQYGLDNMAMSSDTSPTYTYPDTGLYTIALIANPGETCTDTFFQTIHVTKRYLDVGFTFSFPDCSSGLVISANDFSIDTTTGIQSWYWELSNLASFSLQSTEQNPSFTIQNGGDYTLSLIATAGNGCKDTLAKDFHAPFVEINFTTDTLTICPGDTVPLNPTGDPTLLYTWTPDISLSDPMVPNPLAFPDTTTRYMVLVQSNISPCTAEKDITVQVIDHGELILTATPPSIKLGESTQLLADLPGAVAFLWEPDPSLSATDIPNPVATPTDTTLYSVKAFYSSGCSFSASILVPVLVPVCGEPFVFFPTGFSPNGDGENDALKLEGNFVKTAYWVVFDRWGEKLFEANTLEDTWDGTYKGKAMPAETYGYYLRVECVKGDVLEKKGNVTLLR